MNASTSDLLPAVISPVVPPLAADSDDLHTTGPLGIHPAATLFPMMHGPELGMLVQDIEQNGLREAIVLYEGLVLDGRNRLYACELAQVPPRFVEWDGVGSPVAFVLSRNLHRRHLNESQRSIVAARAKGMFEEEGQARDELNRFAKREGTPSAEVRDDKISREFPVGANLHPRVNAQAAELLNVSARSVASASRVLEGGDEEVIAAIDAGSISVSDAATVVELPKPEQRQALEAVRAGRARTLRQAAKIELPEETPPAVLPRDEVERTFSRKRLRVECKRFAIEHEKLVRRVDAVAMACGGPNDYTQRARDSLAVALRAIQECLINFGRRVRT